MVAAQQARSKYIGPVEVGPQRGTCSKEQVESPFLKGGAQPHPSISPNHPIPLKARQYSYRDIRFGMKLVKRPVNLYYLGWRKVNRSVPPS